MAIISQETFDKFTEEEKEKLCQNYSKDYDAETRVILEDIFGKHNLQPKIKTWEDVETEYPEYAYDIIDFTKLVGCNTNILDKLIATYKIAKLIELGYGGVITAEDRQHDTGYYVIYPVITLGGLQVVCSIDTNVAGRDFIAFHTKQQTEEFMSYLENVRLVEQYYMM